MIEPRYQSEQVTLYCADCLEVLSQSNLIDVIIADPPYGIGEAKHDNASRSCLAISKDYGIHNWDNERWSERYIFEMLSASKNQIIFGGNYYADLLPPSPGWIVWDKHNGKNDFADCELAWTSYNRAIRQIDWTWHGMIRQENEERYHPTQKPLGVMKWIIGNYTNSNDLILDPCMGSGTTGVAAIQLGRRFVGIEIDEKYYQIAERRIREAEMQLRLPF